MNKIKEIKRKLVAMHGDYDHEDYFYGYLEALSDHNIVNADEYIDIREYLNKTLYLDL